MRDGDEQLLRFDADELADYDRSRAAATLDSENGDSYRAQLVAAHWIDSWLEGVEGMRGGPVTSHSADWHEGFTYAMHEIAAHLRQGDLIPGGDLHDQTLRKLATGD